MTRGWYRRAARAMRASNQQELPLEPFRLVATPAVPLKLMRTDCPPASRMSQDQYRCHICNLVWGIDEARPTCLDIAPVKEQRT